MSSQPAGAFLGDPHTALAAVLLFDQVPRNVFRGSPKRFVFDPLASAITHGALAHRYERRLTARERQFLAMPLMHSEAIADQQESLRQFAALRRDYGWDFAREHHQMIARFGRFPHRNQVLGRNSTPKEERAIRAGFAW